MISKVAIKLNANVDLNKTEQKDKNLQRRLKAIRSQTPCSNERTRTTVSQNKYNKVKDIWRKINQIENYKIIEKVVPSSTKNHK